MSVVINGSAGVTTNSGAVYDGITAGTAKAYNWNSSTSNTYIDFENIPSWVKRITVMFQGVSTNGTSNLQIQLGSSSVTTTGYLSSASTNGSTNANSTTGLLLTGGTDAASTYSGCVQINLLNSNGWVSNGLLGRSDAATTNMSGGSVTLSGTLDRIRVTTVGGANTFDAGSINILYE